MQCYDGSCSSYKHIMLPGVELCCQLTEDKQTIDDVTDTIRAEVFGLHEVGLRRRSVRNVLALCGQYRHCFCIGLQSNWTWYVRKRFIMGFVVTTVVIMTVVIVCM